jgi:mevalonate kinase
MASAPGSLKLFGELAVIYDRLGLSAAFDRRAFSEIKKAEDGVSINLIDLGKRGKLSFSEIASSHGRIREMIEKMDMEGLGRERKDIFSPCKMILGEFFSQFGFSPIEISIHSDVPRNSGLGSSAAVFCSLAGELNNFFHTALSKNQVAALANLGDKVVHGNPSGLDASTCTFGGYVSLRRSEGVNLLQIKTEVQMLVVNSGSNKNTGEIISRVAEMYKNKRSQTDKIFDRMEETALSGIKALKSLDLKTLGENMNIAQQCFVGLGLSTPRIDEIISTASKNGALGAKITGAGGGGCVTILAEKPSSLIAHYKKSGYDVFETKLGVEGVS